ncbi:hypothetical protein NSTCB13_01033 [Nostoc sp. DSM 114160]|jgi:hypothetical protein
MALLATLEVQFHVGSGQNQTTQKAWFLGAKGVYADADMATATGITDVTNTLAGQVPLHDVDQLLLHGIIRTVEVDLGGSDNKIVGQRAIRYSGLKSATIEADILGKKYAGGKSAKFNNTTVKEVIERRNKSFV